MVYTLFYRRPAQVPSSAGSSLSGDQKKQSIQISIKSGCSCSSNGIPDALSFDRIIAGGTCPPLTVRDMANYMKYVEHSAENLQFFLWYRDYCSRFDNLPEKQKSLSPEWTKDDAEAALQSARSKTSATVQLARYTPVNSARVDPFNTPPETPSHLDEKQISDSASVSGSDTTLTTPIPSPPAAITRAPVWMPHTGQPYRDEITRIITVYISDNAPRQLNLSDRERRTLLHALQKTTHPSAFQDIIVSTEYSLRQQSHPNFIRWTTCNGNRSRVIFARGLGIFGITAGFIADLIITLSRANRAWRVLPFFAWFIGIATLFAAWKGMCVVLHGLHHRHLRPWELFEDTVEEAAVAKHNASITSPTGDSRNSYEDEPWVPRYEKQNIIRKIFDRQVWIEEPALRQIQDTIFVQAIATAFFTSCIIVGIFGAVPAGNLF